MGHGHKASFPFILTCLPVQWELFGFVSGSLEYYQNFLYYSTTEVRTLKQFQHLTADIRFKAPQFPSKIVQGQQFKHI